jgi:FkbM family methyltransferase
MSLITINDHTIDESLLTQHGWVMDIGCLNMGFARPMAERCMNVIAFDPSPKAKDIHHPLISFFNCGVQGANGLTRSWYEMKGGAEGWNTHSARGGPDNELVNVIGFHSAWGLVCPTRPVLDVLKLDCEGAEYEILHAVNIPVARQITVEFHDFRGFNPRGEKYHVELRRSLGRWYDFVQYERRTPAWGGAPTYADCLFVLKDKFL